MSDRDIFAADDEAPVWLNAIARGDEPATLEYWAEQARQDELGRAAQREQLAQAEAERVARHEEWQAQREARDAAELAEAERLAAVERAVTAERELEHASITAAYAEACDALIQQDADFHALEVYFDFEADAEDVWVAPHSEYDPAGFSCGVGRDAPTLAEKTNRLIGQIPKALDEWFDHYGAMKLLRADGLGSHMLRGLDQDQPGATFFMVYRADDEVLEPSTLGTAIAALKIDAMPDVKLQLNISARAVNATLLFEAARTCECAPGRWGGQPTIDLKPRQDEGRDDWLARIALPTRSLARNTERWKRSGGNLKLYGLIGSGDERAAGNAPIDWLIPGLLPRGYVTLLVGTKQAGKSTLAGEIAAVFDSECQSARSVLGVEVEARGFAGIVSGEDGNNFINRRQDFYAPVHGEPLGLVIDVAEIPWAEALPLLHELPNLDFLVVDPMRAIMQGDEDSSAVVSRMFEELNALAREKNCAILLVHHLSKVTPRSLSKMLQAVRGSGVATDRPRIVIGMIDRGSGIIGVGIIKHNIPPGEPVWGEVNVERLFRRDAATLTLVSVETPSPTAAGSDDGSAAQDAVCAAIAEHNRQGIVLRRTGKSELFERKVPSLASLSRGAIRAIVTTLLAVGRLVDGPAGLKVNDTPVASAHSP